MKADKFDKTGKKVGQVDLPASLFPEKFSKAAIHSVIRIENNNRRQGTHKTKGFSEVSGGGKKPWRQKGTGNARQGSTRAPQWRGGGTVFGPVPRDYTIRLPEKIRKQGIRSIFSARASVNGVLVIEDVDTDSFSTKAMVSIFKNMGLLPGNTIALVSDSEKQTVKKSLANIPQIRFIHATRLTAPELYYSSQLVITQGALDYLAGAYDTKKSEAGVS